MFPVSDPPCPSAGVASMADNCRPLVVHEGARVWAAAWAAVCGSLAGIARGVVGINQVAKVHIFKLFHVETDRHLNGGHIMFLNFLSYQVLFFARICFSKNISGKFNVLRVVAFMEVSFTKFFFAALFESVFTFTPGSKMIWLFHVDFFLIRLAFLAFLIFVHN